MEQAANSRTVRIYRRDGSWIVDVGRRQVPGVAALRAYLPPGLKEIHREYYSIQDALQGGITPQILTGALSGWYTDHGNVGEVRSEEGASELPDNTAYMALGDYIYKMIPVRQASATRAVRIMREKVKREAEALGVQLKRQAGQEAEQILVQAQTTAARIRAEAQKEMDKVTGSLKFPAWLCSYTVKMNSGRTAYVQLLTRFTFTEVAYKEKHWRMAAPVGISTRVWFPLMGNPELVHLDDRGDCLPHINTGSACVKIGEAVKPINTYDDLVAFQSQIVRAFRTINLASLLTPDVSRWPAPLVAALPEGINKWLRIYTERDAQNSTAGIAALPSADATETGAETWTVQ